MPSSEDSVRQAANDHALAQLDPYEIAWGVPLGCEPAVGQLDWRGPAHVSGLSALEAIVAEALLRQPCTVSFSGGRDSSAVLAIATHVARREGLPDPIPVTNRFSAVPESDERHWQEMVIRHLGLSDWVRLELQDELDIVGPVASQTLLRHGLLAPANCHFHVPMLQVAHGGSLLSGLGGDEVLGPTSRGALGRVLFGRRLPRRRQLKPFAASTLPRRLRQASAGTGFDVYAWVKPKALQEIRRRYTAWVAQEPISYRRSLATWLWPSRYLQCSLASLRLLAGDHDVQIVHPFAEPRFLTAYGASRGALGPPGRIWALRELVGDLLPSALIERHTKSAFDGAFWSGSSRTFAENWTGDGVDEDIIDLERLRTAWLVPEPDSHTSLLLQQAFLTARMARKA